MATPIFDPPQPPVRPWRVRVARWAGQALWWKAGREARIERDALRGARGFDIGVGRGRPHGDQVLRGFIQINILPRPR